MRYSALDESGRYNNIKAQVILKEAYDIQSGLYNHEDPALSHPLQLHLWTEKKSVRKWGMLKEYQRKYHIHQIKRYYGIDFIDFMGLPIDIANFLLESANELADEDARRAELAANADTKEFNSIEQNLKQMGDVLRGDNDYFAPGIV